MQRLLTLTATTLLVMTSATAFAADHLDGPAVSNDPSADINDLYAFVNPNDPNELILAMTVMPLATEQSQFSNVVDYQFNIQNTASGAAPTTIACRFRGKAVVCDGPNDLHVAGPVGRVNEGDGMRVFAGLRDDPFFFDLVAYLDTVATVTPQFTNPGQDFFEGLNTLSVVIGVQSSWLINEGESSVLKVYASSTRSEKQGKESVDKQVDRMGRPAVNTALIDLFASTGLKDQYNQASDVSDWAPMFQSEIAFSLAALDTLDGVVGNNLLPPMVLASVLVDDRLLIDVANPACDAYLAVELGAAQCGGRTLERDVIDDTFGAIVGPGVSDFVSNTSTFLGDFPFLGTPN